MAYWLLSTFVLFGEEGLKRVEGRNLSGRHAVENWVDSLSTFAESEHVSKQDAAMIHVPHGFEVIDRSING